MIKTTLVERTSSLRPQIVGVALALTIGLSGAVATAQDASPSAAEGVVCAMTMETASPAATAAASPVAGELEGEPVTDEVIIAQLTEAATTCNQAAAGSIDVADVQKYGPNLYGIEYQYTQGAQVFRVLEMYSVEHDTVTQRQQQSKSAQSDEDMITISAKIGGDPGLEVSPGSFNFTPAMQVTILNRDTADLSLALFSTTGEVDTDALAGTVAASLPETMELQGETVVPGSASGNMLFEGLEEGSYLLVVLDSNDAVLAASPLTIDAPLDLGL